MAKAINRRSAVMAEPYNFKSLADFETTLYDDLARFERQGIEAHPRGWRIYTDQNVYSISANVANDYLGCTVKSRKPRAGESHCRGRDLPDGGFDRQTWHRILAGIVSYEMVKVHGQQKPFEAAVHAWPREPSEVDRPWPLRYLIGKDYYVINLQGTIFDIKHADDGSVTLSARGGREEYTFGKQSGPEFQVIGGRIYKVQTCNFDGDYEMEDQGPYVSQMPPEIDTPIGAHWRDISTGYNYRWTGKLWERLPDINTVEPYSQADGDAREAARLQQIKDDVDNLARDSAGPYVPGDLVQLREVPDGYEPRIMWVKLLHDDGMIECRWDYGRRSKLFPAGDLMPVPADDGKAVQSVGA
jgi:hypothetical protein